MLRIKSLLVDHDPLTLTVFLSVTDAEHGVREVQVVDRFGLTLFHESYQEDDPARHVQLPPASRTRFPLFVDATAGDAETAHLGPIFPAPTDEQHGKGAPVPLPRAAVDLDNDPEIRRLRAAVRRGDAAAREIERTWARHDDVRRDGRSTVQSLSMMAAIFSAAALVVAGQGSPWWLLLTAGVVALLFAGSAALVLRRQAGLTAVAKAAADGNAAPLEERQRAAARLDDLGLSHLATTGGTPCGCASKA